MVDADAQIWGGRIEIYMVQCRKGRTTNTHHIFLLVN